MGREEAWRREALRIYRRYQVEVVEALSICPWAVRARRDGRVREEVLLEPALDVQHALAAMRRLEAEPSVDIGLVIFPAVEIERPGFERFVRKVRDADADRHDGSPPMALAAFHPHAAADLRHPSRLVPFLRRSPDPTIQLVRISVLEHVRRATETGTGFFDMRLIDLIRPERPDSATPLHERVAETNLETVRRLGVEHFEAIFDSIRADRDAAYARVRAL